MKKIIKLTESDLVKIVTKVLKEQSEPEKEVPQTNKKTREFIQNVKYSSSYGTKENQIQVILYANDSVEFVPGTVIDRIKIEPTITLTSNVPFNKEQSEEQIFKTVRDSIANGSSIKVSKEGKPVIGEYIEVPNYSISVKYRITASPTVLFTTIKGKQIQKNIHT